MSKLKYKYDIVIIETKSSRLELDMPKTISKEDEKVITEKVGELDQQFNKNSERYKVIRSIIEKQGNSKD